MQWEIQPRSRFCCKCQREFLDGDKYRCVLTYREEQPFRRDFCEECWERHQQLQLEQEEGVISWWQSIVKIPPSRPKEEAIKRSLAEELLRKYLDFPEDRYINFCYILALMLQRHRLLSQKHTVQDGYTGKSIVIYEHTRTGETFLIKDPNLTLSQVDKVQAQVKEILDSEEKARAAPEEKESAEGENRNQHGEEGTPQPSDRK